MWPLWQYCTPFILLFCLYIYIYIYTGKYTTHRFLHDKFNHCSQCINLHYIWSGLGIAHRFSERIARFLLKNERISDLLTSLIFGERPEQFAHIAHQKRVNERIAHFLNKKTILKHTKKLDFRFF